MRNFIVIITTLISLTPMSCAVENPNKAKTKKLLKEISEIAENSRQEQHSQNIMEIIKGINEKRELFPSSRQDYKDDVVKVKNFFIKNQGANRLVIQKFQELLKLNLVEWEASCARYQIDTTKLMDSKTELTIAEYDLLLDEDINDKATLETKILPLREKSRKFDEQLQELESQNKGVCRPEDK